MTPKSLSPIRILPLDAEFVQDHTKWVNFIKEKVETILEETQEDIITEMSWVAYEDDGEHLQVLFPTRLLSDPSVGGAIRQKLQEIKPLVSLTVQNSTHNKRPSALFVVETPGDVNVYAYTVDVWENAKLVFGDSYSLVEYPEINSVFPHQTNLN